MVGLPYIFWKAFCVWARVKTMVGIKQAQKKFRIPYVLINTTDFSNALKIHFMYLINVR